MGKAFAATAQLRLGFAMGASALAMGMAAPALAQAADDNNNNEIVVTAQFREQNLQDTPLSITAVDADLLQSRNQTDLSQIAAQAPNVTLNAMGGAYGSSLGASIRGIGQFDFNPAYEPGVGIYIDDVYYATLTGGIFDLLDLERVEVLRGPQGTLTGRNSIGGAIKLFSKKPTDQFEGYAEGTYGTRDRTELRAGVNLPLGAGLSARLSGVMKKQDGYVRQLDYGCAFPGNTQGIAKLPGTGANCVISRLGEKDYMGVRGALRYDGGDALDIVIVGDYTKEDRSNAAEVITRINPAKVSPTYQCGRFCTYASFSAPISGQATAGLNVQPNSTDFEGWGVSANVTLGLSDSLNLQSITAYRDYRQVWGTDDDFTPDPVIVGQGYNDLKFHFFSQELRLNGKIGDNMEFTLGGFYSDQKSLYYTRQDIRYIVPGVPFLYLQFKGNDPVNADSKAAFGTVIWRPVEGMTLTGGLRYTKEHKDYTFIRQTYSGGVLNDVFGVGTLNGTTAVYNGDRWDWRISADYRFSPEVLAYVTVGTGFKGGGVTARPFDVAQALNGSFGPETVTAYEAGIKTDLIDRTLRMNVSAFINDYKDIQLPLISCASLGSNAPCGARQNAGSGKIKGVEIEINMQPTEGFDIDASISHLDGKWSKIDPRVGNAILLSDPIVSPNWKFSVGAQYKIDLGSTGSITPRIDMTHTGKTSAGRVAAGGPIEYYDEITLANARITWRNANEDLTVSVEGQNIFNKYYTPFRFAAVYGFSGTIYSQVGRPREWAVTVRKSF
ncbi:MAG: hypothetical protein RIQ46_797 [Pseudomonadota bacterium]|jgi:iron complex outermembrane receptor protein